MDTDEMSLSELLAIREQQQAKIRELEEARDNSTPDEIRQYCRAFAVKHLKPALLKIAELMDTAEKDTTQLSAAKTIYQIAQGTTPKDGDDTLTDFFKSLASDK